MDLTIALNAFLVFIIYFVMFLLLLLAWWVFVLVLYAPSFRLRKLKKLIREDNMEYNEILADKSRLNIEKANTQLQYDKLVVQKSNIYDEIKQLEKERKEVSQQLTANSDAMTMLNEFLNTPDGKKWLASYAALQVSKANQTASAEAVVTAEVATEVKKTKTKSK